MDVKEKIRACKNEQEMLKVLADARIELDPEMMEMVAGGDITYDLQHLCD